MNLITECWRGASHGGEQLSVRSRPCELKSRHTPGAGSGDEISSRGKGVMTVSGMGILAHCVLLLNLRAGHLDVFSLCYFIKLTFCELACTYLKDSKKCIWSLSSFLPSLSLGKDSIEFISMNPRKWLHCLQCPGQLWILKIPVPSSASYRNGIRKSLSLQGAHWEPPCRGSYQGDQPRMPLGFRGSHMPLKGQAHLQRA